MNAHPYQELSKLIDHAASLRSSHQRLARATPIPQVRASRLHSRRQCHVRDPVRLRPEADASKHVCSSSPPLLSSSALSDSIASSLCSSPFMMPRSWWLTVLLSCRVGRSWDAAKFEVCAHKFADLSEFGYGISIVNDCKYGYAVDGDTMRFVLPYEMACPKTPLSLV
jgi:hypothetical protein